MKNWLKDLSGAWTFYTIFPGLPFTNPRYKRIARFAPWVGIVLGIIQSILWYFLVSIQWPNTSVALIVLVFGIWSTGGLHHDGLIDTADGIGAGDERCLEAMRDSRVGANGVISLLIIISLHIAALIKLQNMAIFAFPIAGFWSRCAPLIAIQRFDYLHKKGGASFHRENMRVWQDKVPSLFGFIFLTCLAINIPLIYSLKSNLLLAFLTGIIPTFIVPQILGKKLGGHSGDSYGATVVLVEVFCIILCAVCLEGF